MPLSVKTFLAQIMKLSPLLKSCSLETIRKGQDMIGELIEAKNKNNVIIKIIIKASKYHILNDLQPVSLRKTPRSILLFFRKSVISFESPDIPSLKFRCKSPISVPFY